MSDVVWQALIAGIVTVVLAWLQMRTQAAIKEAAHLAAVKVEEVQRGAELSAELAAIKVESVAKTLANTTMSANEKFANLTELTKDTHSLVNSNMAVQLKLTATVSRRLAELTGLAEDIKAAELAEHLSMEHDTKQAALDVAKEKL